MDEELELKYTKTITLTQKYNDCNPCWEDRLKDLLQILTEEHIPVANTQITLHAYEHTIVVKKNESLEGWWAGECERDLMDLPKNSPVR